MKYETIAGNIIAQIRDYLQLKKAVIGISGGIDSAVVAALCAEAVGRQQVLGVLMPYATQDTADARLVVEHLQIPNLELNIQKEVDAKVSKLEQALGQVSKVTKGNIMARERMITLYALANELNGLVVGTSNKTEIELGYFTKYGDGGVDIEPIGDLYKTEVFKLARYIKIPEKIITKAPSAGLWEGQTDEAEIGLTYTELDAMLKGEKPESEILKQLRKSAQHKLKMPPIFNAREIR